MSKLVIKNGTIINEGKSYVADLLINNQFIERIDSTIEVEGAKEYDAEGKWVIPGVIDDQVHFREPGLTHKASIFSESRAAAIGGVTSYMEMPNTKPPGITNSDIERKYELASNYSHVNYSFYLGATNSNIEEVKRVNPKTVCGIKIFMGSSTGNMLVDDHRALESIFKEAPCLIATHCEDEETIRVNLEKYMKEYGDNIPFEMHPIIRNEKACYLSSSFAIQLAQSFDSRLHILHISTAEEIDLFGNDVPLDQKKITSEVCVHHLHFSSNDYIKHGGNIKCNPAIKHRKHRKALWQGLLDDHLDIIATDHAPHTVYEKNQEYAKCPSGIPLVQHGLNIIIEKVKAGLLTKEKMVEKMCHSPAICFGIDRRGFLREGYHADIVILNPEDYWTVNKDNLAYKCAWSPFEDDIFSSHIECTMINGQTIYNEKSNEVELGYSQRLSFTRK